MNRPAAKRFAPDPTDRRPSAVRRPPCSADPWPAVKAGGFRHGSGGGRARSAPEATPTNLREVRTGREVQGCSSSPRFRGTPMRTRTRLLKRRTADGQTTPIVAAPDLPFHPGLRVVDERPRGPSPQARIATAENLPLRFAGRAPRGCRCRHRQPQRNGASARAAEMSDSGAGHAFPRTTHRQPPKEPRKGP